MSLSQARSSKAKASRILFRLFTICWIFDLKANPDETWLLPIQQGLFGISLIAVALAVVLGHLELRANKFLLSYAVILFFIIVSTVSGIFLWNNDISRVFANDATLLTFLFAIFMVDSVRSQGGNLYKLMDFVIISVFVATFGRFFLVLALRNVDYDTVRYQILCGAVPWGMSYIVTRVFARLLLKDLIFILFQISLSILSVTRTLILTTATSVGLLIIFTYRKFTNEGTTGGLRNMARALVGIGAIGVISLMAIAFLPGHVAERWRDRLETLSSGFAGYTDMSLLSRQGLIDYQFQQLERSTTAQLIGYGIAAEGGYGDSYAGVLQEFDINDIAGSTGFGDNVYTSLLYLGGYPAGGAMLLIMFLWGISALSVIRQLGLYRVERYFDLLVPPLASITFLIACAFGAVLSDRMSCLFFGYAVAFTFWIGEVLRKQLRAAVRQLHPLAAHRGQSQLSTGRSRAPGAGLRH